MINSINSTRILSIVVLVNIFSFKVLGRDYLGLILLISVSIYLFLKERVTSKIIKVGFVLSIYYIYIMIISFTRFFDGSYKVLDIFEILIYTFIPFISLVCGMILKFNMKNFIVLCRILIIGEFLICVAQLKNSFFRDVTLNMYSNIGKYGSKFGTNGERVVGSIGNPNTLSLLIVILLIGIIINYMKSKRNIDLVIILLGVIIILQTKSRTGLIMFFSSLIIILLFGKFRKKTKLAFCFVSICILCILNSGMLATLNRMEINNIKDLGGRTQIWDSRLEDVGGLDYIYGSNNYSASYNENIADNFYLDVFLRYGVVGVTIYLINWIIIVRFVNLYGKNDNKLLINTIISIVLMSDITGTFYRNIKIEIFLYILIGSVLVIDKKISD